ncbi:MAG: mechanosensitive ion channel domain-containing protein [Tangfeifania sp.]
MENIFNIFESLLQPTIVLLILIILLVFNAWVFSKFKSTASDGIITKRTVSFLLILVGTLAFILALPIDKALKGQILSFLGIIISAGIALSSTTVLGNLIAGIMNNSMNCFRNGDLINIENLQGRVIRKSAFHTEIQLEDSNFITIPNLYIASNPVKLIRNTNTVISTSVSLGYDVPRNEIEDALKKAAEETGLTDPYVYITNLGDFSVVYKIHGFLEDSSKFFSTSSQLNAQVMDKLHEKNIEIVSPTFMNQRRVDEKQFVSKKKMNKAQSKKSATPEDLVFDEAIKSEKLEKKKDNLREIEKKQEQLKAQLKEAGNDADKEEIKSAIERNEKTRTKIQKNIEKQIEKNKEEKE